MPPTRRGPAREEVFRIYQDAPTPSPTEVVYCSRCHKNLPYTLFRQRPNGAFYNTCRDCKDRRTLQRVTLTEIEGNNIYAPRRTRAGTVLEPIKPVWPVLRPRNNALETEGQRITRIRERTATRRAQRALNQVNKPPGFISMLAPEPAHFLGGMIEVCGSCRALHWVGEADISGQFELCCKKGDAEIEPLRDPGPVLRALWTAQDPVGREFRAEARGYNMAMSFVSVNYHQDTRVDLAQGGIHSFQIQGQLFHIQGPLEPNDNPCFAQLFFYDAAYATDQRLTAHPRLQRATLTVLHTELLSINPFIEVYKTARERLSEVARDESFRIALNPQIRLIAEHGSDLRRNNLPTTDEVAVVIPDELTDWAARDIVLAVRTPARNGGIAVDNHFSRIPVTHAAYMPLAYTLLFPHGEYGWHYGLQLHNPDGVRKNTRLGQRVFYRHRLHVRSRFSALFYAQKLFQQYVVDAYSACEATALAWLRSHQANIRADVYTGLADAMLIGDVNSDDLGRKVILPSGFTGGDRAMQKSFQDSMAIVRHFGKPSFFITFTASPRWAEIVDNLFPGQAATDRPDLVARVFHMKVQELIKDLKGGLFGPYSAHVMTIEYQKRGLPHMHLLLFLGSTATFLTADRVNEVVCAEIPDPAWDPNSEITALVTASMVHGPCGLLDPTAPCMQQKPGSDEKRCVKRFPKPFTNTTIIREDGYPEYRRREDGRMFIRAGKQLNNSFVVPYNPYLLRKYRCHINVEVCGTVRAVKYIHKYVYKGSDRTTLTVQNPNDEIETYLAGRYIGPIEAVTKLFEYPSHQEWPPVIALTVHLEGQHIVYFPDDLDPEELAERTVNARSTLIGYFDYNKANPLGPKYLYPDFPAHFVWQPRYKTWKVREKGFAIGRMFHMSPVAGERFYLRLLLTVVPGAQSFTELYIHEGVRYYTYHAACVARGLTENDNEWFQCFDEAVSFASAKSLRVLFMMGLRHKCIADPSAVWMKYRVHLCDDLKYQLAQDMPVAGLPIGFLDPEYDYGLYMIYIGLLDMQCTLLQHGLPSNSFNWAVYHLSTGGGNRDRALEASLGSTMQSQLNSEQLRTFETIIHAVNTRPETAHFYLQGPGGTGKTFLYKTICHHYRGLGKTVFCVASTGIAALLLPEGRTSHSQFKIPIDLHEDSTCSVTKTSALARSLRTVDLIIWDEVPMQHKYCFEAVNRLLCDLRSCPDRLFGGVPVIFGGDFAQILPVIPNGSRTDIVRSCLQKSSIWPQLKRLHLRTNMRVRGGPNDEEFINWIGSLPYNPALNGSLSIPSYVSQPVDIDALLNIIYPLPLLQAAIRDKEVFRSRTILSVLNTTVTDINQKVIDIFPGEGRRYSSVDSCDVNESTEGLDEIPMEFLHSVDLPNLPPSTLHLKLGCPVLLLRNLSPQDGLCNGSRMVITGLRKWCIEVCLLGGDFHGQHRTIPRIKLHSSERDLTFTLFRKQFPVRLCFAMTVNKGQGQSFDIVGIDLRTPVFTHGQFYVAVSRTSSVAGLYVLLPENGAHTCNIVYPEVVRDINGVI